MNEFFGATWRKSSRSNSQGDCVEVADVTWRKSSRSNSQGQCVEVSDDFGGLVGVRDSKDPHGPVLTISPTGWITFVEALRSHAIHR